MAKSLFDIEQSEDYLKHMAGRLETDGVRIEMRLLAARGPASAIDQSARKYRADMIACST